LIENIVFLELQRKTNSNPLLEVFYWKDYQEREVDFIIKEGSQINQLIQVTYALTPENKKREIRSLLKASRELNCKNLLMITWDQEEDLKEGNKKIKVTQLWKWLIEQ